MGLKPGLKRRHASKPPSLNCNPPVKYFAMLNMKITNESFFFKLLCYCYSLSNPTCVPSRLNQLEFYARFNVNRQKNA